MDTGLKCDVEVICYGDGEIDCTDDEGKYLLIHFYFKLMSRIYYAIINLLLSLLLLKN